MTSKAKSRQGGAEAGQLGAATRPLARATALYLLAFVLLYRPMACGLVPEVGSLASFGMLLLAAVFFWVADGVLSGTLRWRAGAETAWLAAFLAWGLVSAACGSNALASAKVWWLFATYGLTAFMVLQLADCGPRRCWLMSCLLATVVTLAAYAILQYLVYRPAFRDWIQREPDYFKALFEVRGAGFQDFFVRVTGNRAVGNFLTSNQLAAFLLVGLFPLCAVTAAGWAGRKAERAGRRRWLAAATCVACSGMALAAFALSRSKGAMIAAAFGLVVLVVVAARQWLRRNLFKALAAVGIAAMLFLAGQRVGLAPGWQRFGASLGVRLNYWRVSMQMVRDHPVVGVGTGCWEDNYVMRKLPEYEETRMAHSCFLQVWSEMGTVGFVLFALLCGSFMVRALRGMGAGPTPETAEEERSHPPVRGGLALGAAVFVLDAVFVGTFKPPQSGGPRMLQAAPWLGYVVLFGIWAGAFVAVHEVLSGQQQARARAEGFAAAGLLAGLAAFLLHSAAEFTFRTPALGGTAFGVAALVLMQAARPRTRETPVAGGRGAVLVILAFTPAMMWAALVAPRAFEYAGQKARVFELKAELSGKKGPASRPLTQQEALKKRREVIGAYRAALRAVPWDSECWHDLAVECLVVARELWTRPPSGVGPAAAREAQDLLGDAEDAALRAVKLNPLKAQNHLTAAMVLEQAGKRAEAIRHFARAAELHPSVPESWFLLAEALRRAEGLAPGGRACEAYRKAHALNVREVDRQGRLVRGQYHERNLLSGEEGLQLERRLSECAGRDGR